MDRIRLAPVMPARCAVALCAAALLGVPVTAPVAAGAPAPVAAEPVQVTPAPIDVVSAAPVVAVEGLALPGDAVDVVADGEGSGYLTVTRGPILRFRLPTEPGGELELTPVTEPLTEARGVAIRDGVLYAVELGAFPCAAESRLCEGGDVPDMPNPSDGEAAIVEAMRARLLAWDIAGDGTLGEPRTVLTDLPVVSSLHAPNGLELGPDGLLYLPVGSVDRLWWDPDRVLGRTPHADWLGTVLRFDGSGAAPEVVATGLRNVYEVAFDSGDRLWGVDNDGVAQDGFRTEELLQIKVGRRYGYPQEGTFGPKTLRDDGPLWVVDMNGTGALASATDVGLGEGLLMGDCGRVALLQPNVVVPADRWWQGVIAQPRTLVGRIPGCVTSLEPVGFERLVAVTYEGDGSGLLLAMTIKPPPAPSGGPQRPPKWEPPS